MADSASIPACIHPQLLRIPRPAAYAVATHESFRIHKRDYSCSWSKAWHMSGESSLAYGTSATSMKGSLCLKKRSSRCHCFPELVASESLPPLYWVPLADQVLLATSIICAYIAGVIPNERSFPRSGSKITDQESLNAYSTYGRCSKFDSCSGLKDSWLLVEKKLTDALASLQDDNAPDSRETEFEFKGNTLCLSAIAEGPRLRLMWATLGHLKREVNNILPNYEVVNWDLWLAATSEVIKKAIEPVYIKWLKEELTLANEEPNQELMEKISEKLKAHDAILKDINRTGKAELYANLLFFLRFGTLRAESYFSGKIFEEHMIDLLEDLVIMIADVIANIYLELISVDSSLSNEMNAFTTSFCYLSTRALQKLRNEVALNQWLQQYFESVVAMYEDRFELLVIRRQQLENPIDDQSNQLSWLKKLKFGKPAAPSGLHYFQIQPYSLAVKRTKELRSLTGWRYYFSLFLEFSDIAMPLVKVVVAKVRSAISFFLVCLIGRSLGLIYTGIRQSFGWR